MLKSSSSACRPNDIVCTVVKLYNKKVAIDGSLLGSLVLALSITAVNLHCTTKHACVLILCECFPQRSLTVVFCYINPHITYFLQFSYLLATA